MEKNHVPRIGRKARYNARAYKTLSTKVKPDLYNEIQELKDDLGLSFPDLLRKLIYVYKSQRTVYTAANINQTNKGENTMMNNTIEKLTKEINETGVWVKLRISEAEAALGEHIKDQDRYRAAKLIVDQRGDLQVISIADKLPRIHAYNISAAELAARNGVPALIIKEDPEYYDWYLEEDEEYESAQAYTESFLKSWELSTDELHRYSKEVEKNNLEEVVLLIEKEPKEDNAEELASHSNTLIRDILSEDGAWVRIHNPNAALLGGSDKESNPYISYPAKLLTRDNTLLIQSFIGFPEPTTSVHSYTTYGYDTKDIAFEEALDSITLIRKGKPQIEDGFYGKDEAQYKDYLLDYFDTWHVTKEELENLDIDSLSQVTLV